MLLHGDEETARKFNSTNSDCKEGTISKSRSIFVIMIRLVCLNIWRQQAAFKM